MKIQRRGFRRANGWWTPGVTSRRALLLMLLGATLAAAPAEAAAADGGADADQPPRWIANPELCMRLTVFELPAGFTPPAEYVAGDEFVLPGEVFDSADYQSMLCVAERWPLIYEVSLATSDVRAYPRVEVEFDEGLPCALPASGSTSAGMFMTDNEGQILFADAYADVAIAPVPPLVGTITRAELQARQPIYERRAADYTPDPAALRALSAINAPVTVIAFFGTWCSVCKHVVPALLATVDQSENEQITVELVGLDENVSQPAELIERHAIYTTPTLVILRDGTEVGRIESEPQMAVEWDLVDILDADRGR